MKKGARLSAAVLSLAMVFSLLAGCGQSNVSESTAAGQSAGQSTSPATTGALDYLNATGDLIVKKPITLKAMVMKTGTHANIDYSSIPVWGQLEKKTGIKIEFDEVVKDAIAEKRNLAFASGDLPDIFFRCNIPGTDIDRYGEQGLLIDMSGLIEKYGPNMQEVMKTMSDVKKGITSSTGAVYSLPCISGSAEFSCKKFFINQKWLDKVGLQMPTTTDEYYNVLKAFKEKDPNGNGLADEIGYTSFIASGWPAAIVLDVFRGAFGLGNRGYSLSNFYVDLDETTNKVRFMPTTPEFKQFLEFCAKLYNEGLMDQDIFTTDSKMVGVKGEQNLIGSVGANYNNIVGATYSPDFAGIPAALKGPAGIQAWTMRQPHLTLKGAFAITSACKYPEAATRWIDYFYGDEGIRHLYMGVEGETYKKDASGKYVYMQEEMLKNEPAGTQFKDITAKSFAWGGGYMPTITKAEYFIGAETEPINVNAVQNMEPFFPKELWSDFSYTKDESDIMTPIALDINGYLDQMIPKFVMGKASLSSDWDSFVGQLDKMKLGEYMKIYQAAYERYNKN